MNVKAHHHWLPWVQQAWTWPDSDFIPTHSQFLEQVEIVISSILWPSALLPHKGSQWGAPPPQIPLILTLPSFFIFLPPQSYMASAFHA